MPHHVQGVVDRTGLYHGLTKLERKSADHIGVEDAIAKEIRFSFVEISWG